VQPGARRRSVQLAAGSEVWLTADDRELSAALCRRLEALGLRPRPAPCADLAALPAPPSLGGLLIVAPAQVDDAFVCDALRALRNAAERLRAAGVRGGAVMATLSRLDGAFGLLGIDPDRDPVDAGLSGLAKTAAHEWPEVQCKALDLAADFTSADDAAAAVIEELLLVGPAEVGISAHGLRTIERVPVPLPAVAGPVPLAAGDVVVLSGGARGITAEAAVALARTLRPTLVLLGRSPEPGPEPEWLAPLTGEAQIKRELALRANGSASPRQVGEQYRQLAAGREVRQTLERVAAAGGRAVYRSVDVRDRTAVAEALAAVRRELGPVRALVHGAGVLADARIEGKTDEQFHRVWWTKVGGLRNLLDAVAAEELRAVVLFGSSSARFGRAGQADYAAANEVLNKQARRLARRLGGCRVVCFNWGPWDGGMVDSGLRELFEAEGVGLIDPTAGAEFLVRELSADDGAAEVVVLAPGRAPDLATAATPAAAEVMVSLPPPLPVAFERVVGCTNYPVLESHQLDGRPVVPLVLLLEWLAHAALHHNPGLVFHGCDDLRVVNGVILEGEAAPVVRVGAAKAVRRDGLFVAAAEVRGRRADGRDVLHARADVVLSGQLPPAPSPAGLPPLDPYGRPVAEVYRELLFHGPMLRGIEAVEGCGTAGVSGRVLTSGSPTAWVAEPLRQRWLADPLALDAAFQLMVVWSREQRGAPSLPCHVRRYRQFRRGFPTGMVRAIAGVTHAAAMHALADIDFVDADGRLVARLEGYDCVIDPALERAFARPAVAV
jgi:NAD(P)-dependent dehydrogenase (short-subunit alcohol dehydrogenase family)